MSTSDSDLRQPGAIAPSCSLAQSSFTALRKACQKGFVSQLREDYSDHERRRGEADGSAGSSGGASSGAEFWGEVSFQPVWTEALDERKVMEGRIWSAILLSFIGQRRHAW